MVKIKLSVLIPVIIFLGIAATSYFFLLPSYRNDCGKPLTGYDLLFVYSPACPHCKADFTRIEDLNLTEKFYMIDGGSATCEKIIGEYSDYLVYHKDSNTPNAKAGLGTPTKVCLRDNKTYVGEMTEIELKGFYENCTGVKI